MKLTKEERAKLRAGDYDRHDTGDYMRDLLDDLDNADALAQEYDAALSASQAQTEKVRGLLRDIVTALRPAGYSAYRDGECVGCGGVRLHDIECAVLAAKTEVA